MLQKKKSNGESSCTSTLCNRQATGSPGVCKEIASRGSSAVLCGAGSKAALGVYSDNLQEQDGSYLLGTCSSSRQRMKIPSAQISPLFPEPYFSTKLYLSIKAFLKFCSTQRKLFQNASFHTSDWLYLSISFV